MLRSMSSLTHRSSGIGKRPLHLVIYSLVLALFLSAGLLVTEQMQYDNRGRLTNETLQISASGGSLTFPSFPTYQLSQSYNDDDQPTTTTSSSNPSGLGYSFTNFYDSASGALTGLGKTTSAANLATLSYNCERSAGHVHLPEQHQHCSGPGTIQLRH